VEPSRYLADQHAKRAPTFVYYFDQVAMSERGKTPGAEHGGEVEYLFGNKPADQTWDDADRRVSKLMGDYWVRFAASGGVAVAGDPAWTPITPASQAFLVFDADTHMAQPSPLSLKTKALDLAGATPGWTDDKN
jgi:para-nitrobenzyl esterase